MRLWLLLLSGLLLPLRPVLAEVNQPPIAGDYTWSIDPNPAVGQQFTLYTSALLAVCQPGPPDESSQTLLVTAVPSPSTGGAIVTLNAAATPPSITYTVPVGFNHTDSFTYTVVDNGTTHGVFDPKAAIGTVTVVDGFPPTVTTPTSALVTNSIARLGGDVTSDGYLPVTERGVVYSLTSENNDPTIGGAGVTKVATTGTTGAFSVVVNGLTPRTSYSFKAYATNLAGTGYTSPASTFGTIGAAPVLSAPIGVLLAIGLAAGGVLALRRKSAR